jgi:hypothetical protein
MKIDIYDFDAVYPLGKSATHPIELPATRLGYCSSLQAVAWPRRRAYPDAPPVAQLGAFN